MTVAVYTDVVAEELGAFLAGYDIGELLAYKGIAEGVENSNFLVHTSRGYFILTLYEKRVAASDLPFFLGLMEHLALRGLTCPQPVKNRAGTAQGTLAGRPAAIVTFLEGMWLRRPGAAHCAAVGEELSGLIDFYFACTDTLAYDVAICLNAWCFEPDHSYNVTKGRGLLQAYAAFRPLGRAERDALPLLARGAALRFLLTRLADW